MHDATHLPLLLPKVQPPRLGPKLVARPRLARYISAIEDVPLTIVSAPSGFGKTTAGATWARELKKGSAIVGWLSLDKEDDDPTRFLQYLAFAVTYAFHEQSGHVVAGDGMAQQALKGYQLISDLINYITEEGSEFFLFLDDLQVIASAAIKEALQFLLRHAPSNLHLILLSHPHGVAGFTHPRPAAELRLHASDLCFTEAETRELFSAYSGRESQACTAHAISGGWVAALRIMAASNTVCDTRPAATTESLMTEDSLDKLLAALLSGLNPDEVRLIETTCLVGRMCAPLFTSLTEIRDPKNVILSVEVRHNLVSRISADGHWFSCHDLVRNSVMKRLAADNPALVADVMTRASHWYAAQGYWSEAVSQALAAGDRALAFAWIDTCAPLLLYRGDLLTLLAWERRLGLTSMPGTSVKILMSIALARVLAADRDDPSALTKLFDLIESRLSDDAVAVATVVTMQSRWHLQAIRSVFACRNDEPQKALALSLACLDQPVSYRSLTETLRDVAGYSYLQFRQWEKFYEVLTAVSRAPDNEYTFLSMIYRHILLGLAAITQLNFTRAQRYLEDAHHQSHQKLGKISVPGALSAGLLAFIHHERLDLQKAEPLLSDVLDLVGHSGYVDIICCTYTAAVQVASLRRDKEGALALLEKWERIASAADGARLQVVCAYEKMCFFLREKAYAQAGACLAHIRRLDDVARAKGEVSPQLASYVGLAEGQSALAGGRHAAAKAFLESVYEQAMRQEDAYIAVLSGMLLAIAESRLDRNDHAMRILDQVLAMAQGAGLKASLLCQPVDASPLLAVHGKYASRSASGLRLAAFIKALSDARSGNFGDATISLSPREASVLRLLAQDKSNKEISSILQIAPETVKTHLKSIFTKLNVSKRNAAVRRAASMNLL